eukprot:1190496-Prorocentrum_minimum.AAC.2
MGAGGPVKRSTVIKKSSTLVNALYYNKRVHSVFQSVFAPIDPRIDSRVSAPPRRDVVDAVAASLLADCEAKRLGGNKFSGAETAFNEGF